MSLPDPSTLYEALRADPARLRELRRLTYRCRADGCLLLDAVATPVGVVVHEPRYKYSPEVNARRSNPRLRASGTVDGERHWKAETYYLAGPDPKLPRAPAGILVVESLDTDLTCDHVLTQRLTETTFAADWDAGHAEIRVRRDGSRYSVH